MHSLYRLLYVPDRVVKRVRARLDSLDGFPPSVTNAKTA